MAMFGPSIAIRIAIVRAILSAIFIFPLVFSSAAVVHIQRRFYMLMTAVKHLSRCACYVLIATIPQLSLTESRRTREFHLSAASQTSTETNVRQFSREKNNKREKRRNKCALLNCRR